MLRLIGITGRARAGKNTTAELIAELLPSLNVRVAAFADPLKVSAMRALGYDGSEAELIAKANLLKTSGSVTADLDEDGDDLAELSESTGREFLQRYGTEAHRSVFGDDFWVDATLPRPYADGQVRDFRGDADLLVIADVRFENEARRIRDLGGEVWQVVRPGLPAPTDGADAHVSEAGLPTALIDRVVINREPDSSIGVPLRDVVRNALKLAGLNPSNVTFFTPTPNQKVWFGVDFGRDGAAVTAVHYDEEPAHMTAIRSLNAKATAAVVADVEARRAWQDDQAETEAALEEEREGSAAREDVLPIGEPVWVKQHPNPALRDAMGEVRGWTGKQYTVQLLNRDLMPATAGRVWCYPHEVEELPF